MVKKITKMQKKKSCQNCPIWLKNCNFEPLCLIKLCVTEKKTCKQIKISHEL